MELERVAYAVDLRPGAGRSALKELGGPVVHRGRLIDDQVVAPVRPDLVRICWSQDAMVRTGILEGAVRF
ncbi:hypothetical protein ACFWPV_12660 [Streptomyces uncialis]|uniref:hypothetical protein n=1 Tax=Streptomyces uncialis TaxID=1048205 RepID=UPI00364EFA47